MGLPKDQKDWMDKQSGWFQELSEHMKSLLTVQKEIKEILETMEAKQMPVDYNVDLRKNVSEIKEKMTNDTQIQSLTANVSEIQKHVSTYIQQVVEEKNKNLVVAEGYKFRKKFAKDWFKCLNTRKIAYYNKIRYEGLIQIYSSFLNRETPFIPRKFLEKPVPDESEEQKRMKFELAKDKMLIEIARMKDQIVKQDSIISEQGRMVGEISNRSDEVTTRQCLKEIWYKETQREEEKSNNIWSRKKTWFEKLPEQGENSNNDLPDSAANPQQNGKREYQRGKFYRKRRTNVNFDNERNAPRRDYSNAVKYGFPKPRSHQNHQNGPGRRPILTRTVPNERFFYQRRRQQDYQQEQHRQTNTTNTNGGQNNRPHYAKNRGNNRPHYANNGGNNRPHYADNGGNNRPHYVNDGGNNGRNNSEEGHQGNPFLWQRQKQRFRKKFRK